MKLLFITFGSYLTSLFFKSYYLDEDAKMFQR